MTWGSINQIGIETEVLKQCCGQDVSIQSVERRAGVCGTPHDEKARQELSHAPEIDVPMGVTGVAGARIVGIDGANVVEVMVSTEACKKVDTGQDTRRLMFLVGSCEQNNGKRALLWRHAGKVPHDRNGCRHTALHVRQTSAWQPSLRHRDFGRESLWIERKGRQRAVVFGAHRIGVTEKYNRPIGAATQHSVSIASPVRIIGEILNATSIVLTVLSQQTHNRFRSDPLLRSRTDTLDLSEIERDSFCLFE
jgi:hypothetical protein